VNHPAQQPGPLLPWRRGVGVSGSWKACAGHTSSSSVVLRVLCDPRTGWTGCTDWTGHGRVVITIKWVVMVVTVGAGRVEGTVFSIRR
jgi:hypothetical protein